MKQKLIDSTLYVFDVTPYEITADTEADVIKVQQEVVDGFKELNESLADKIVPYNYHTFTITRQEWADYVDEPDPEPVTGYTFTLEGYDFASHAAVYFDGVEQEMTGEWTDVAPGTMITIVPTEDPSYYTANDQPVTWDDENNRWYVEMPEDDLYVSIDYNGAPEPVGYTFTLTGNDIHQHCTVSFDGTAQEMTGEWTDVAPGTMITIVPTEEPGYYTINEQDYVIWDNENNCWAVEMPEDDLTVTIDYTGDGGGESGAS